MFNASRAMVRQINTSRTATFATKNCSCSGGGAKPQANPTRTYGVSRLRPAGVTVTGARAPGANRILGSRPGVMPRRGPGHQISGDSFFTPGGVHCRESHGQWKCNS